MSSLRHACNYNHGIKHESSNKTSPKWKALIFLSQNSCCGYVQQIKWKWRKKTILYNFCLSLWQLRQSKRCEVVPACKCHLLTSIRNAYFHMAIYARTHVNHQLMFVFEPGPRAMGVGINERLFNWIWHLCCNFSLRANSSVSVSAKCRWFDSIFTPFCLSFIHIYCENLFV